MLGSAVGQVFSSFGDWSNLDVGEYNCSINNIIRGHWYSREQNEDRRNNIDANTMTSRGKCKAYRLED